jgi:predicted metallo-beta-lactamase superfamily hydrolase
MAEQVNIDRETVKKILTKHHDIRKVCAKMVPKELTEEQKQRRVEVVTHLNRVALYLGLLREALRKEKQCHGR